MTTPQNERAENVTTPPGTKMSFVQCIHGRNVSFSDADQFCSACAGPDYVARRIDWLEMASRRAHDRMPLSHLMRSIASVRVVAALLGEP